MEDILLLTAVGWDLSKLRGSGWHMCLSVPGHNSTHSLTGLGGKSQRPLSPQYWEEGHWMSLVDVPPSTSPGNTICAAFCGLMWQGMTLTLLLPEI